MRLTVEIPNDLICDVANRAVLAEFRSENGFRGPGTIEINKAVRIEVASIDWRPIVQEAISRLQRGVVDDEVGKELRKMIGESIRRGRDEGTLFGRPDEENVA